MTSRSSPCRAEARRLQALAAAQQTRRRAVERMGVFLGRLARAVDDRLVVAGEEAVAASPSGEMRTGRKFFSKNARASLASFGFASPRPSAGLDAAPRNIGRPRARRRAGARIALQLLQEGRERRVVIVLGPAVDLGPVDRLVLAVADLESGRGFGSASACAGNAPSDRGCGGCRDQSCSAGCKRGLPAVIALLRWRPVSSWDRATTTSRANVQTSVTSVTLSGLPSITAPDAVARHRDELRHETHGDLRGLAARLGGDDVGAVDRDEARLDRLAALLALLDRGFEAVVDLARRADS